jgi:hypothetical protein
MIDFLSQLLGDMNQERTITIKTKPQKRDAPPEMPLDGSSANIPQNVLDLMRMQAMAMQDPMQSFQQMPMSQNPYGMV